MENVLLDDNFTSELNETSTSPAVLVGRPRHLFIFVLNIFLSITASLGNPLILIALRKETGLHPPTKLLFRCLAATDLCVGLITQPLFAITVMPHDTRKNWVVLNYFITGNYISSYMLCGVSGLTSSAISVDRLLALSLGLRYRHVVTLTRVRAVLITFWLLGVTGGLMYLWSDGITLIGVFVFVLLCIITSIFSYTKIYLKLRQHHIKLKFKTMFTRKELPSTLNATRRQFPVYHGIESIIWMNGISIDHAWQSTATLVYLNSSLNPFLYCWKMREVRQAVKDTVRQFCCRAAS